MREPGFDQLLERHRRELHVHCYRMLGSYTDAEDLVQETFLRAWRSRDRRQPGSNLRAWLYRIATNACTDVIRAGGGRPPLTGCAAVPVSRSGRRARTDGPRADPDNPRGPLIIGGPGDARRCRPASGSRSRWTPARWPDVETAAAWDAGR